MRIWKEIWDYAKMIIIVVVIVTLVNSVVLINAKIPSESMEKTIVEPTSLFMEWGTLETINLKSKSLVRVKYSLSVGCVIVCPRFLTLILRFFSKSLAEK